MLNLFVFAAYPKLEKGPWITNEEYSVQDQGQPNWPGNRWHQLTVGLGRILIGIGSKLTQEETMQCETGNLVL